MALGSFILGGGGINPYPVGSVYISTNDTSPAELFCGNWEQIKDVFLLASGDSYEAGSTGGGAQHSHAYAVTYASNYNNVVGGSGNYAVMAYDGTTGTAMLLLLILEPELVTNLVQFPQLQTKR